MERRRRHSDSAVARSGPPGNSPLHASRRIGTSQPARGLGPPECEVFLTSRGRANKLGPDLPKAREEDFEADLRPVASRRNSHGPKQHLLQPPSAADLPRTPGAAPRSSRTRPSTSSGRRPAAPPAPARRSSLGHRAWSTDPVAPRSCAMPWPVMPLPPPPRGLAPKRLGQRVPRRVHPERKRPGAILREHPLVRGREEHSSVVPLPRWIVVLLAVQVEDEVHRSGHLVGEAPRKPRPDGTHVAGVGPDDPRQGREDDRHRQHPRTPARAAGSPGTQRLQSASEGVTGLPARSVRPAVASTTSLATSVSESTTTVS